MYKKNKTSGFVKSPLMQMNTSNIVIDQKGTLLGEVEKIIRNGYEIQVLEIEKQEVRKYESKKAN